MPMVYRFTAFPSQLGFVVGPDGTLWEAATEALQSWANDCVTQHNLGAYTEAGTIELVRSFPNTDQGWEEAFEHADGLEEY